MNRYMITIGSDATITAVKSIEKLTKYSPRYANIARGKVFFSDS
jgi:hypothetical protein